MNILYRLLLLALPFSAFSQDLPTPIVGHPFARPGVTNSTPSKGLSIEYDRHPNYELGSDFMTVDQLPKTDVEAKERFEAKLKFPIVLRPQLKILGDIYHSFERYHFDEISPPENVYFRTIDGQRLKRTRLTFYALHPINRKHYLAFRTEVSLNGDFRGLFGFEERYAVYRAAGLWGIKFREDDEELGLGLMLNKGFRRTRVLPFAIYNRTFNDKWGLESVLPVRVGLRRNINEKNILMLNAEYWSSAYAIQVETPSPAVPDEFYFRSAALQFYVDWMSNHLTEWTWLTLKLGYSYNFDSEFVGIHDRVKIGAFPSHSVFITVGFSLCLPKRYLKR